MDDNPQEALICSTDVVYGDQEYCMEFIRHKDLHVYIYLNGLKTDCFIVRSYHDYNYKDHINTDPYGLSNIIEHTWTGKSKYNVRLIEGIFKIYAAEHYV